MKPNKRTLIRWKVYIDRARMYIGYIQFIMIGFVFLEAYKDSSVGKLIFENLYLSLPILFLIFILLSLIIGRIDTILGFREEELRNSSTSNPVMRELLTKIDDLKDEIVMLKSNKNN
ncbi:hypothetical protein [Gaetbulibacter jejuensis]|uniref:Uncharacterized protein n=1 Tax=Gaetbulibacter jejuensis TaxID=584607 RepID=A0ABN1JN98_9FLAO